MDLKQIEIKEQQVPEIRHCIKLFDSEDSLKYILDELEKDINHVVIIYENHAGNVLFQFYTDKFNIKYDIDNDNEDNDKFNILCNNYKKYLSNIFMYLSKTNVKNIFIITNDEDYGHTVIDKEIYYNLKFENSPNVYLTFRNTFIFFNPYEYLPNNLIINLYFSDNLKNNKWIKWQQEFFSTDEEQREIIIEYLHP